MTEPFPGIEDALTAVEEINDTIDSITPSIQDKPESYALPLTAHFESGGYAAVEYLGIILWDNNDNNIPWAENGNERAMSLKDFLLKQMRELVSQVQEQCELLTKALQSG
jgi:hypothetical protein